jgi:hypothetical protein
MGGVRNDGAAVNRGCRTLQTNDHRRVGLAQTSYPWSALG